MNEPFTKSKISVANNSWATRTKTKSTTQVCKPVKRSTIMTMNGMPAPYETLLLKSVVCEVPLSNLMSIQFLHCGDNHVGNLAFQLTGDLILDLVSKQTIYHPDLVVICPHVHGTNQNYTVCPCWKRHRRRWRAWFPWVHDCHRKPSFPVCHADISFRCSDPTNIS